MILSTPLMVPAAIHDHAKAQSKDLIVLGLLLGDPPAEIDVDQLDAVGGQPISEFREDHLDEMVALGVHVAERRRDEHANGLPRAGHDDVPNIYSSQPAQLCWAAATNVTYRMEAFLGK